MSLEPKKPIEELLDTTAKARRAQFGTDAKMPNPMRAQLHQEIERVARRDDPRRSGNWLQVLWPRVAFTTVCALILVSISTLWWWHEHPSSSSGGAMKLAMQAPAGEAPPPEKVFEQGAAAGGRTAAPTFADSNAAAVHPVEAAKDSDALRAFAEPTIASNPSPTLEGFAASGNKGEQSPLADGSLVAKEAKPAAPAAASLAQSPQITNFRQQAAEHAVNQDFRRKLKETANILNEFQAEQTGHEIRLVDADGSTYSGELEPLGQNDTRSIYNQKRNFDAASARGTPSFAEKTDSANVEYYFRASGYNTTLKKSLEIEGNYVAPSAVPQKKVAKAMTDSEERAKQSSARITGIAKIPGESPVQIDAIAVP